MCQCSGVMQVLIELCATGCASDIQRQIARDRRGNRRATTCADGIRLGQHRCWLLPIDELHRCHILVVFGRAGDFLVGACNE
jgi:hypothetical protein